MESRLSVCVCVWVCEYVYLQIAHEACHSLSDVFVVGAAVETLKEQTQVCGLNLLVCVALRPQQQVYAALSYLRP